LYFEAGIQGDLGGNRKSLEKEGIYGE